MSDYTVDHMCLRIMQVVQALRTSHSALRLFNSLLDFALRLSFFFSPSSKALLDGLKAFSHFRLHNITCKQLLC